MLTKAWTGLSRKWCQSLHFRYGVTAIIAGIIIGTPILTAGFVNELFGHARYWEIFAVWFVFPLMGTYWTVRSFLPSEELME